MLPTLFLLGSALFGMSLSRRALRGLLNSAEVVFWGTVLGWVLATVLIYGLARWQGQLTHSQVVWTTALMWIGAIAFSWRQLRAYRRFNFPALWQRQYAGLCLVLLIFAPVYWRLFSTHMFARGEGGYYSGGGAWYDLSFHAGLASSFVYGQNFPPLYTLRPPEPLLYPFLPDFQIAVLMNAGLSLRGALLATSFVLAVATTGLFYSFAWRIIRGQRAATLATILFLLNGGLGFIYFFYDWWHSSQSLYQLWATLDVNYAAYPLRGIYWTNLINLFPAQRTILFGAPLALMILTIFVVVWQRSHQIHEKELSPAQTQVSDWLMMLIAGVLTGLLPFFHTHTYIAIGLISGVLFILKPRREWLIFWAPALLFAFPHIWELWRLATGVSVLRWLPGWLGHNEQFLPVYLVRDFGLPLLLAIPAWIAAPPVWRRFYLAFLLVFIFALTIVVSPNLFDNGKLTYYWHALNSVLVASWLIRIAVAMWARVLAGMAVLLCVASGILALQCESHNWSRVFSDEDVVIAEFVRDHTSPRALFLTAPVFNQPAFCLAGRSVLLGPAAWLWSHGHEFRDRDADVRRIYAGTEDALELLRYYGIDYIYLSDWERQHLRARESFFESNFLPIYRQNRVTIYDARNANSGNSPGVTIRAGALNQPAPRELAPRLDRDPYAVIANFPETSFFVYRLCKASYGRMPRRDEFMRNMSELTRGLFIGANLDQKQLVTNRTSLLDAWTSSNEFKQFYDGKTNADFVSSILLNAGLRWNADQRATLIQSLDSKALSRQSALLSVVEDKSFYATEYNTAYVLVHYFGYLRRNPDDPPDHDLRGLIFWREILDRGRDYPNTSRAFVESLEYNALTPR